MKTTEIIQKPGLSVTLVGGQLLINVNREHHTVSIASLKRKLDKHTDTLDFPTFVNSTGLSEKDKNLIKGVFYDWISEVKRD